MANITVKYKLNVLKFFQLLIDKWNGAGHCLAPIKYSAPLSVQKMNQYVTRWGDACKYHAFLTRLDIGTTFRTSQNTGYQTYQETNHRFEIYFVKPMDSTGTQVHNEVDDDRENLVDGIISEVFECLGVGEPFEECTEDNDFEVTAWTAYPVIYAEDSNYTGWKVIGTFTQRVDKNMTYKSATLKK